MLRPSAALMLSALLCSPALAQPTTGLSPMERMQAQSFMMAGGLLQGARHCHIQGFVFTEADVARLAANANAKYAASNLGGEVATRAVAEIDELARSELAAGHLDQAGCMKLREGVRLMAPDVALDPLP